MIVTSTSEVYGTALETPIKETHPRQPQSPYSATKIGADAIAESFYLSFNLPVTIVRPFNTYGPRQSARAVIPTIITQLLDGKDIIELGAISPTRDLVFVKDTVEGFYQIGNSVATIGQDINIATQSDISIGDLAQLIINKINPSARILTKEERLRPEKSEVNQLLGSALKLAELTNWQPGISLEEGLDETINWFKYDTNRASYKSHIYNV